MNTTTITPEAARKLARALISKKLILVCGMDIDDVPDTAEMCSMSDDLQDMIEGNIERLDDDDFKKELKQFLDENINDDTIEQLIL